jgi:hypothetical protein
MMVLQQIKHCEDNNLPISCCKLCNGSTFVFIAKLWNFFEISICASSSKDGWDKVGHKLVAHIPKALKVHSHLTLSQC